MNRLEDAGYFPKVILIDTCSFCDLRCSMCAHKDMKRKKGVMTWRLFTKIINEIAERDRNARVWLVFFGEALILKNSRPSIFDMIAYSKKKGLTDVVLNTNGKLLDIDAADKLIESGLDAIYVGIDAFTPETYDRLRIGGDYWSVVRNVESFMAYKEGLEIRHPKIFVQFVEMEENFEERDQFVRYWTHRGAEVKIRPKVSWAGAVDAPNLTAGNMERHPCYWAMQTMSITNEGKVVTCAVDVEAKFVAGDVNNNSLSEIWNGTLKDLRAMHLAGDYSWLPHHCFSCRDWQAARAEFY
jgi:radical SAM protein with 4Fe4S-binding SPASM domain